MAPICPPLTIFDGNASYGAALLGYQFRTEALIVKLFAGVKAEDQRISPRDSSNSVQGSAVGHKLQAESWLDLSPLWFLSLDASCGTAFQQYRSLARVGRRLGPRLSLGLEGGALGNQEYDAGRGGGSEWLCTRSRSHSPAASPAIISKTNRAAMCRSASIAPSDALAGCTAGPAPAVLASSALRAPKA